MTSLAPRQPPTDPSAGAISDRVVDDPPTLHRYVGEMRRSMESLSLLVDDLFELA